MTARFERVAAVVAWLTLALAGVACAWVAQSEVAGWFSDSVDYLVIADFFRQRFGLGGGIEQAAEVFRGSRFPPLYALTLALGGAGTGAQAAGFVVTAATQLLAGIAAWWWFRSAVERKADAALLASALFVCVGFWLWPADLMSEPLFLLLLLCALRLAERLQPRHVLLFGAVLGLLPLVRTVGLVAIVAAIPFLLRERALGVARKVVVLVVALLPYAVWTTYRTMLGTKGYSGTFSLERMEAAFGGFAGLLTVQPMRLIRAIAHNVDPQVGFLAFALTILLLAAGAVGWWLRFRRNRFDAWVMPPYLGLVWIWPYPAEVDRLMFVLVPLLLLAAYEGVRALSSRFGRERAGHAAATALLVGVVVASAATTIQFVRHALIPVDPELETYKRRLSFLISPDAKVAKDQLELYARLIGTMRGAASAVPADDCFYAENAGLAWLQSRRPTVSYPTGFDPSRPVAAQLPACDYFLVSEFSTKQHQLSGRALMREVIGFTMPVLASFVDVPGHEPQLVVALTQRTAPAGAGE